MLILRHLNHIISTFQSNKKLNITYHQIFINYSLKTTMISKVFHLADLHIRKGDFTESRFIEYNNVFINAVNDIKRLYVKDESICVICGDIFHHKLQISSHGIVLFYNVIHSIANIMPVIIIQGNHDS